MKRYFIFLVLLMSLLPALPQKYENRYTRIQGLDQFFTTYFSCQNDGSYTKKTDKPLILVLVEESERYQIKYFIRFVNKYLTDFNLTDVECVVVEQNNLKNYASALDALMPGYGGNTAYPILAGWDSHKRYVGHRVGLLLRFFSKKDKSKGLTRENLIFPDDFTKKFFEILWDAGGY